MSEKPEALEVAAALRERIAKAPSWDSTRTLLVCDDAARCIEKLHAEIERLHDELRQSSIDTTRAEIERLREALALAERLAAGRLALVEQLTDEVGAVRREAERLREALEIIAGYRQCVDSLMGNQDVAIAALRREET